MNQATSITTGAAVSNSEQLSSLERILMVVPLLAGVIFGVFPYLFTSGFANVTGYPGNDHYIYRLAGAATFGYAVAVAGALRDGRWASIRLLVIAILTFNLGSLIACFTAILGGNTPTIVYLILAASIILIAITSYLLYNHRNAPAPMPDVAQYAVTITIVSLIIAALTGAGGLFAPVLFGHTFGYKATDVFIYQQAGAATLGYTVMGIFQVRSRAWVEWRWATVMAATFNGLSFLASLWSIFKSSDVDPIALPLIVAVVALSVTVASLLIFQREGK